MTLKKIEGFDILDHTSKIPAKFYSNLTKASVAQATDSGTFTENHVGFVAGRYDGGALSLSHINDYAGYYCQVDMMDSHLYGCLEGFLGFGSYLKMPVFNVLKSAVYNLYGIVGFSFKTSKLMSEVANFPTTADYGQPILYIGNLRNNNPMCAVIITPNNKIGIHLYGSSQTVNATQSNNDGTFRGLFTSSSNYYESAGTFTLAANVWYNIEVRYGMSGSSTPNVTVTVNGLEVLNATVGVGSNPDSNGYDGNGAYLCCGVMKGYSNSIENYVTASGVGNFTHTFDNFYLMDNGGSSANSTMGGFRVRKQAPSGNFLTEGANVGGSTHWVSVSGNDGDTSYVACATGNREVFNMRQINPTGGILVGLEYTFVAAKSIVTGLNVTPVFKNPAGSYGYGSGVAITGGGSYWYHGAVVQRRPTDSAAWTFSDINDGALGLRLDIL